MVIPFFSCSIEKIMKMKNLMLILLSIVIANMSYVTAQGVTKHVEHMKTKKFHIYFFTPQNFEINHLRRSKVVGDLTVLITPEDSLKSIVLHLTITAREPIKAIDKVILTNQNEATSHTINLERLYVEKKRNWNHRYRLELPIESWQLLTHQFAKNKILFKSDEEIKFKVYPARRVINRWNDAFYLLELNHDLG